VPQAHGILEGKMAEAAGLMIMRTYGTAPFGKALGLNVLSGRFSTGGLVSCFKDETWRDPEGKGLRPTRARDLQGQGLKPMRDLSHHGFSQEALHLTRKSHG